VDPHLSCSEVLDVDSEVGNQSEHGLDVADGRDVRQQHRLPGQQACSHDRQGRVLVPGGANGAVQRAAAFDHEGFHQGIGNSSLRHQGRPVLGQ
jgi:hypothetical protein